MTKFARRTIIKGGIATAALIAAPAIVRGQTKPAAARTIRAVFHGDIPTYDPIWTTANMSAYHGGMVYDTLFGIDDKQQPQPQMVKKWSLSDDKLTWSFELRDGLKWHDRRCPALAQALGGARRRRPAHDAARQGNRRQGR